MALLIAFGETPIIRIIDYLPDTASFALERKLISAFKLAGHDILNGYAEVESKDYNRWPYWASTQPSRQEMREIINYWSRQRIELVKRDIKYE